MAVPEVKCDQPSLIPQKRSASIPDSAPIPKKPNNTTGATRKRSDKKRDDSPRPRDSKSTENLTEGEVFRRLEAVRTEMTTISWYIGLPETLKIPEILSSLTCLNGRIKTRLISHWRRHRKPDGDRKDKKDEGLEDSKNEKNEEAKDDYEDATQEE